MNATIVKKISVRSVVGGKRQLTDLAKLSATGVTTNIMRVIGSVQKIAEGIGEYGEWCGFIGSYKATNLLDGQIFTSSKCFLPDLITNMLRSAFVDATNAINFALDIGIKSLEDGYEYVVTPLLEMTEINELSLIEKNIEPVRISTVPKIEI